MAGKRQIVREDLTRRILEAATARIAAYGLGDLRARDITKDAGCGLGTIYKCFEDLDELIMRVNAQTLGKLDRVLGEAYASANGADAQLHAMAQAYLAFALEHGRLWSALFEHHLDDGAKWPDWYLAHHGQLLRYIRSPLAALQPSLDNETLDLRMRSIFASVHGVVKLSLEGRFIGVRQGDLSVEVRAFVAMLVAGAQAIEDGTMRNSD